MSIDACYLGVDGGGTKTRFVLIDAEGHVLAETQRGTTYHPEVGLDHVRGILGDGVAAVTARAEVHPGMIAHAFFGLPAHGEDSDITPLLDAMPAPLLGHARYTCGNDMVCGWAGSLACADGINIVAGTGSIGYGQRSGREARAGGWGETFSDEGSAYWIAVQGLNAFSRMSDGRLPRGPLHALFRDALEIAHDLDACARLYGEQAFSRGRIARLSPVVAQAATRGDPVARRIFDEAGAELAGIAGALRASLGFEDGEPIPVSYSGGAFDAGEGELLCAPFAAALQAVSPAFDLRTPRHEPHYGAALYAAKLAGVTISR